MAQTTEIAGCVVTHLHGDAYLINSRGQELPLEVGQTISPNTMVVTGSASSVLLQGEKFSQLVSESSVFSFQSTDDTDFPYLFSRGEVNLDSLQQALAAGEDLTRVLQTATSGAEERDSIQQGVTLERTADETLAEAGFDTSYAPSNVHEAQHTDSVEYIKPASTVSLSGPAQVYESGGEALYTLTLDRPSDEPITVYINYSPGTAIGGGVDYSEGVSSVTIPAGETSVSFTVDIVDDALSESHEEYRVSLASTSGGKASLGTESSVTTSILDDTNGGGALDGPVVTLTGDLSVGESSGVANYTVSLDKAGAEDVVVTLSYADGTALGEGVDYMDGVATLTIPAGQLSGSFSVAITDDALSENAEDYTVSLASTLGAESSLGSSTSVTTSIVDDTGGGGALDGPVVTLTGDLSVGESAGVANYTVTLDKAGAQDVVVTLKYADGTALGEGVDYTDGVATLIIPAGQLSGSFTVAITDDALSENAEDYTVSLASTLGAESSLGSSTSVTTTIVDDTNGGGALDGPQVTLSGDLSVGESAGVANYTVSLDKVGSQDVVVTLNYADGTALGEGVDYTDGVATLTIPAGQLSGNFTVAITDDVLSENNEDYTVSLASTLGRNPP
ncbi:retention module-containing protein [Dongshaea marina]|uniref:retention module-containing protein n=1 Tax=Dongshaea marina TaxID=2047966 RepID=UPI000D3E344E|nr:retention module-containing protein [Dongshaea marina]